MLPTRAVRIANCSGFYGDRFTALEEQIDGGEVDVVTGDYLAELTMLILAKARSRPGGVGYATTFVRQFNGALTKIASRGIKVVVNAGGLDPAGLAEACRQAIDHAHLGLKVAHIEGDDLTNRIESLVAAGHELRNLDTGVPFEAWGHKAVCANAYLGGWGITTALTAGADIVICGRVTDASLTSGVAAWWWNWTPEDFDQLAGAVLAGHVIECGAQATGGNHSDFRNIPNLEHPGFPIAEIAEDGSAVITKHPGTGGAVTVDTVTAQLLYEVAGAAYLNPDVTAFIDSVRLDECGSDRVCMSGAKGSAPPESLKVVMCAVSGWRNSVTLVVTGSDVPGKIELVKRAVQRRLAHADGVSEVRFTQVGSPDLDSDDQMLASCLLQIAVEGEEWAAGRAFSAMVVEMSLANYPGIYRTGPPSNGQSRGAFWPALVRADQVEHRVIHHDGTSEEVFAHSGTAMMNESVSRPLSEPMPSGEFGSETVVRLGELAQARSGDKGGDVNVGVWVTDDGAYPWLLSALTEQRLRELLPEVRSLDVVRHEFPNLRAVNFVIRGMLAGGAAETLRIDKQGKGVAEWLLSRQLRIPAALLQNTRSERWADQ